MCIILLYMYLYSNAINAAYIQVKHECGLEWKRLLLNVVSVIVLYLCFVEENH